MVILALVYRRGSCHRDDYRVGIVSHWATMVMTGTSFWNAAEDNHMDHFFQKVILLDACSTL